MRIVNADFMRNAPSCWRTVPASALRQLPASLRHLDQLAFSSGGKPFISAAAGLSARFPDARSDGAVTAD
jgi:hypothetical protein